MRRRARRGGGRQVELVVEGLGARGDGFASLDGRPVFVPFTVPGDRVRARLTGERGGGYKAEILELLDEGAGRVEPPCPQGDVRCSSESRRSARANSVRLSGGKQDGGLNSHISYIGHRRHTDGRRCRLKRLLRLANVLRPTPSVR